VKKPLPTGSGFLQDRIILAGNVFHDLRYGAVQNPAQVIDGGGVHGLILSQLVYGGAGKTVVLDQGIGGFLGGTERFPEGFVGNHRMAPFLC
jgi:hypothetical protein